MPTDSLTSIRRSPTATLPVQCSSVQSNVALTDRDRMIETMKSLYQVDQQVKYLHLQAEAEALLQKVQVLKQQQS